MEKNQTEDSQNQLKRTFVYYIDIRNVNEDEIRKYMYDVQERVQSNLLSDEAIFIPVFSETRVVCINPIYIMKADLITQHERLLSELHEQLQIQIDELKEKNEKSNE